MTLALLLTTLNFSRSTRLCRPLSGSNIANNVTFSRRAEAGILPVSVDVLSLVRVLY